MKKKKANIKTEEEKQKEVIEMYNQNLKNKFEPPQKTINNKKFNEEVYKRFEDFEEKKKQKINEQKEEVFQKVKQKRRRKIKYETKEDFLEREKQFIENKQKKIQKQAEEKQLKEQQEQQYTFQPQINASKLQRNKKKQETQKKKDQKDKMLKSRSKSPMLTTQLSQRFYGVKNKSLDKLNTDDVVDRLQDYGLQIQKSRNKKVKQQTKGLFKPQLQAKQMNVDKKIDNELVERKDRDQKQDFIKQNKSKTRDIKKKFIVYKEAKNISKKMEAPYLMQNCWHQNSYMNVNEKKLVEMKSKEICSNIQYVDQKKQQNLKHANIQYNQHQRDRTITEGLPNVIRATKNTIPFNNKFNYESQDSFGDINYTKEDKKRNTIELNSYFQKTH